MAAHRVTTLASRWEARNAGNWFTNSVLGGIVGGIMFAMFEMVMSAILNGRDAFFVPLRMIGGIVLGQQALSPAYSLAGAAVVGITLHLALSVLFGVIFGAGATMLPSLARASRALLLAGASYGVMLWLVNFYVIAPAAGWNWFPDQSNEAVQFMAHAFIFGLGSGVCYNRLVMQRSWFR